MLRGALIALNFLLLSAPGFLEPSLGTSRAYLAATLLLAALNLSLVFFWDRLTPRPEAETVRHVPAAAVAGIAAAFIIGYATTTWLRQILIYPHDAQRADMLVVIQLAIRRLLQGGDPYAIYQVPWNVPLPYGPVMWAPLIAPFLLHADVRFVTIAGMLFVPIAAAIAGVVAAARGERGLALAWLLVIGAIAASPDLRGFVSVAHTPVYWPLLALLAGLVTRERWYAAAVTTGLLIVARTTMVSVAPVLLLAIWYRDRPRLAGSISLLTAATVLPFLPFAIWDPQTLLYGLYGSYQKVMKEFVWTTTWVQHTIGTTGMMLTRGWGRGVQPLQIAVMLVLYAAIAVMLRRGRRPLPWMALALLAFSMTTLWPVTYIYFDVCLLLVCAAVSEAVWTQTPRIVPAWSAVLAASVLAVAAGAAILVPVNAAIDAGTAGARPMLYSGFSSDEREGDVTFAWINGTRAAVLIPRRSRRDATIELVCQPHLPARDTVQQLSASLNGTVIGTVILKDGWQHVSLPAPGRAWQIGVNELTLFLSSAVSPQELGLSGDMRKLSLAVDRLTVSTP